MKTTRLIGVLCLGLAASRLGAEVIEEYLERYFQTFPTAATAAGRHDLDHQLEELTPAIRRQWLDFNRRIAARLTTELRTGSLDIEDRIDHHLLLRQAELQVLDFEALDRPGCDPLFWTEIVGNATVFLLVRDDAPLEERLRAAAARADRIPRLAGAARNALGRCPAARLSSEITAASRRQVAASAVFYRKGFPAAAGADHPELRPLLQRSGANAAEALESLVGFLSGLENRATGSGRLEGLYAERFRNATGISEPTAEVLAAAERALAAKLAETATYGRDLWAEVFPGQAPPRTDRELVRALFERVSEDRAASTEEFVADYRNLVERSIEFVQQRDLITLPEPLTLHLDRSPSFFVGQSVGGVYPAGPYAPSDAKTILFLPTPADEMSPQQRDSFFREFNHHFNVMITPHELVPGHYLQLKIAARHPRKVRALFGDGVYIEGWGTFCERLMLDLGWGGPLDRLAHLKKQLENIARAVVDIRIHTARMNRDEVLRFVREEALQDEQFAANMWVRALTSSPQLTTYYLGYREVMRLYQDVRAARGDDFELRAFMDGMMELGPVPLTYYRSRMLGESLAQGAR